MFDHIIFFNSGVGFETNIFFSFSNPAKTQSLIFYDQKFTFKNVPYNLNAL